MKIFCLHQNFSSDYQAAAPVLSLKPDSALLKDGKPFFVPDFMGAVNYEAQLAVRICRLGKGIPERFAHRYYDAFTVAVSFTATDMLRKAERQGLPWDVATGFDGSAIIGEWVERGLLPPAPGFQLDINRQKAQEGSTAGMCHSIDCFIAYISRFFTLKTGDILFLGAPHAPAPAIVDDHFEGFLAGRKVLEFNCK